MEDNKEKKLVDFPFEGAHYWTQLTTKFADRTPWKPDNPNIILAVIPGTIVKIMVKIGQKVNKGRCLYVLEAMKMKNRILATKSGEVKIIHGIEGKKVAKNELIMELKNLEPKKITKNFQRSKNTQPNNNTV